tara:strand:+ start:187 stop:447 length:261 start_codon:yes stop_codon:yes gene_type:complete
LILFEKAEFIRPEDSLLPDRSLSFPSMDLNFLVKSFTFCWDHAWTQANARNTANRNEKLDILRTSINKNSMERHTYLQFPFLANRK